MKNKSMGKASCQPPDNKMITPIMAAARAPPASSHFLNQANAQKITAAARAISKVVFVNWLIN